MESDRSREDSDVEDVKRTDRKTTNSKAESLSATFKKKKQSA